VLACFFVQIMGLEELLKTVFSVSSYSVQPSFLTLASAYVVAIPRCFLWQRRAAHFNGNKAVLYSKIVKKNTKKSLFVATCIMASNVVARVR